MGLAAVHESWWLFVLRKRGTYLPGSRHHTAYRLVHRTATAPSLQQPLIFWAGKLNVDACGTLSQMNRFSTVTLLVVGADHTCMHGKNRSYVNSASNSCPAVSKYKIGDGHGRKAARPNTAPRCKIEGKQPQDMKVPLIIDRSAFGPPARRSSVGPMLCWAHTLTFFFFVSERQKTHQKGRFAAQCRPID